MDKIEKYLFVYENKDTGEIRVRYQDDAEILDGDSLWLHIATENPQNYVQSLLREFPALVRRMKERKLVE